MADPKAIAQSLQNIETLLNNLKVPFGDDPQDNDDDFSKLFNTIRTTSSNLASATNEKLIRDTLKTLDGKLDNTFGQQDYINPDFINGISHNPVFNFTKLLKTNLGQGLPTLEAEFNLNWSLTDNSSNVEFRNIQLNANSFLNNFTRPIVQEIRTITRSFDPIIGLLTKPIPVIDRVGLNINFLHIAGLSSGESFLEALKTIKALESAIDSNTTGVIEFGSIRIDQDGGFTQLSSSIADPLEQVRNNPALSSVNSLLKATQEVPGGGFNFSILKPDSALNLFLGRKAELFTYTLPELSGSLQKLRYDIPVWAIPPARVGLEASADFKVHSLKFGYETFGLSTVASSAFTQGFFIDTTNPVFTLQANFLADGRVGLPIVFEGGGEVKINGNGGFKLDDPTPGDQKVNLQEIKDNLKKGPSGIFDITVGVKASSTLFIEHITYKPTRILEGVGNLLRGRWREALQKFSERKEWKIAEIDLFDLSFDSSEEAQKPFNPNLYELFDGTKIRLHVGEEFGSKRGVEPASTSEKLLINRGINQETGRIENQIWAFGYEQIEFSSVTELVASAGIGEDQIYINPDADISVRFEGGADSDILQGANLSDVLRGDTGDDILEGRGGSDTLEGGDGEDFLSGGDGNDLLIGNADADVLIGGTGADTASYSTSAAGVSVNLVTGQGFGGDAEGDLLQEIENLEGSNFNDILIGDAGNNTLSGLSSDDFLQGNAGADILIGGAGIDTASYTASTLGVTVNLAIGEGFGGDAEGDLLQEVENLEGSSSSDTLVGNAADNVLRGLSGNDLLSGNAGNDLIDGGRDADTISYANSPNGTIANIDESKSYSNTTYFADLEPSFAIAAGKAMDGFGDTDTLLNIENITGSEFGDILIGNALDNVLQGLAGHDLFIGNAGNDTFYGGLGIDTVSHRRDPSAVTANLTQNQAKDGFGSTDSIYEVENIIGSAFADSLTGDSKNNTILGGDGEDTIDGGAGNDRLFGEDDNDRIFGGIGDDYLVGGSGTGWPSDILDGGIGNDTASYITANSAVAASLAERTGWMGDAMGDQFISIENLEGSFFDDFQVGDNGANVLSGLAGNDTIEGRAGDDTLDGGEGNDTLWSNDGNDLLKGGMGNDTLIGDLGNDSLEGGDGNDRLEGGLGDDWLDGGGGDNRLDAGEGNNTVKSGKGNDTIYAGPGNDVIDAGDGDNQVYAGEGKNQITTGSGNDLIYGGASADIINAGDGNNQIFAAEGNNVIRTGNGNNRIQARGGDDLIYAGAGDDWIQTGDGNDLIYAAEGSNYIDAGTGDNTIYSGSGHDIFVLTRGPGSSTVVQFEVGKDLLGLSGGVTFGQLSISQVTSGQEFLTQVSVAGNSDILATLKWVQASSITSASFTAVA